MSDARAHLARLVALAALGAFAASLLACSGDGSSRKKTRDDDDEEEDEKDDRDRDDHEKKEYPPARPVAFWLAAEWVPVKGELRGGFSGWDIPFEAEIPKGILENTKYGLGKNWVASLETDPLSDRAGPDLALSANDRAFATPEEFAVYVEGPKWKARTVLGTERLPDGRLRFAYTTLDEDHLWVAVWIPVAAERGVQCWTHYYAGIDERTEHRKVERIADVTKWFDRFCESVRLGEPLPPK